MKYLLLLYSLVVVAVLASVLSTRDNTSWYVAALEFDNRQSQFHLTDQQPHFLNSYVCEYAGEFFAGVDICVTYITSHALAFLQTCY